MSVFIPASGVLLRHGDNFGQSRILFAGDLQNDLPAHSESVAGRTHTQQLHHWQVLSYQMSDSVYFSLVVQADDVTDNDMLIYYWPRSKPEAQFQLIDILSSLPVGIGIFVVGESRSGVHSTGQVLAEYTLLNKVDSACRCGPYHGHPEKQPISDAEKYWDGYRTENPTIKTPPSVLSHDGLDVSSQLSLSTLTPHTKSRILDVGCDAGALSVALAGHSPKVRLALCDINTATVETSRATLAANGIGGSVITSNVFSDMTGRLDMIISNPPFRNGIQASPDAAQTLVRGAVRHLNSGGEPCTVASAFLPYLKVLDKVLDSHEVITQAEHFKICRIIMTCQAKEAQLLRAGQGVYAAVRRDTEQHRMALSLIRPV